MKISGYLFIFLAILLVSACDKVDQPRVATTNTGAGPDTSGPVARHKVLLEDYTGHQCGNCPGAAEVASTLHDQYGDDLVVIAVHAGYFSKTDAKYPTSYTTATGNDWNLHYIGENGLYPNGSVNRKNYLSSGIMNKETKWAAMVDAAFKNDEFVVDLELAQNYSPSARSLDLTVKGFFKKAYDKAITITVVLLEDSIIGPQTDYRNQADQHIKDYVFMHMLRAGITGSWGTDFSTTAKATGDSVIMKFDDFVIQPKFNDKHLTVVAIASDKDTREVIEVEKIKVGGMETK